jgi:sugar-specific transcriptional regulator TrmB
VDTGLQELEQSLVRLGLTTLEAAVYIGLLQQGTATGYRIAKLIGKPTGNVYKVIDTLQSKGALEIDHGQTMLCRPTRPSEFLKILKARFDRLHEEAAQQLAKLPDPVDDTRIYQIRDRDHLMTKCHEMLSRATTVVLLDVSPALFQALRRDLERLVAQDTLIAAKVYESTELPGAHLVPDPAPSVIERRWPVEWLKIVVDGLAHVRALLAKSGSTVLQAHWTTSPYLTWSHHVGLASEIAYAALRREIGEHSDIDYVRELDGRMETLLCRHAPGYRRLMAGLGVNVGGVTAQ